MAKLNTLFSGVDAIQPKFNALIQNLNQMTRLSSQPDELEKQFLTLIKYLAFGASKTPVPDSMVKKIEQNIQTQGSAENIQRFMFWTPPQMTLLADHNIKKVLLIGGNGVGKTILSIEQAKKLSLLNLLQNSVQSYPRTVRETLVMIAPEI